MLIISSDNRDLYKMIGQVSHLYLPPLPSTETCSAEVTARNGFSSTFSTNTGTAASFHVSCHAFSASSPAALYFYINTFFSFTLFHRPTCGVRLEALTWQAPSTPRPGQLSNSVQMALPPSYSWLQNISRDTQQKIQLLGF